MTPSEAQTPAAQDHSRDLAALFAAALIMILYHVLDATMRDSQIALAFRNVYLRRVLVIGLALLAAYLAPRAIRRIAQVANIAQVAAGIVLAAFTLIAALFCFLNVSILTDSSQNLLFEYAALLSVLILAAPWERVALYRRSLVKYAPALLIAVGVLAAWEFLVGALDIKQFLLPRPSAIATEFLDIFPKLISGAWYTFQNAAWGYLVGCGAGIAAGLVSARFTRFSRAILPFAIAANSVPIIAFAPIMNFWFGTLNPASKVAIVVVLTFFPAMINTVRGLTSADPAALELMRSYASAQFDVFRKVRVPAALPFVFSALKLATTLSLIGAVVGEFFGGSIVGIGYRIRDAPSRFNYAEAWSAILVVSVLGILFYLAVSLVERLVMPWHVSFRDKSV